MTSFVVSSGATASGLTINSGETGTVQSGGTASATTVNSGGFLNIESGGTSLQDTINSGGIETVSSGGLTISTTLISGTITISGGVTITSGGGEEVVLSGGIASATTVSSGGILTVSSGGIAVSGTVLGDGFEFLSAGGIASNTTVSGAASGGLLGFLSVRSGATSFDTIVNSDGVENVSGGTASGTVVFSGGAQQLSSGGTSFDTTINSSGVEYVFSGTASGTVVSSGGFEVVSSGGSATGTMLLSSGVEIVSGGTASGTIVSSGGIQDVSPGIAFSTVLVGGGSQTIESGGTASNTVVGSGATIDVIGDTASLVFAGGNTFDNATINIGSTNGNFITAADPVGTGSVLSFGTNAVVNHISGTAFLTSDDNPGDGIVNGGFISASAAGGLLDLGFLNDFHNLGTIQVRNGDRVFIRPFGSFINFNNGHLTAGAYDIGSGSIIELGSGQLVTELDGATVILGGAGAQLEAIGANGVEENLDQTLTTIDAGSQLTVTGDATLFFQNTLSVAGFFQLGGVGTKTNAISIVTTHAINLDGRNETVNGTISDEVGAGTGTGVGTVIVNGGGSVLLVGSNTYTGGTIVADAGTVLAIGDDTNLGGSASFLQLNPETTLELTSIFGSSYTLAHRIDVNGDPTFLVDPGVSVTISGLIEDGANPGTVEVSGGVMGAGTLGLANSNTYTGGTIIHSGTLEIAASGGAGTGGITFASGTVATLRVDGAALPANSQLANAVSGFTPGDDINLTGVPFAGLAGATINTADLLTVSAGGTTYSLKLAPPPVSGFNNDVFVFQDDRNGNTDIIASSGTVNINSSTLTSPIVFNGATVSASNGTTVNDALVLNGGRLVADSGTKINDIVLSSGGLLSAFSATIANAVVSDGGLLLASAASVFTAAIEHGGVVTLDAASTANSNRNFGDEEVFGSALFDSVGLGGTENVYGFASATEVGNGGVLTALSGTLVNSLIDAGGLVVVNRPGSANGGTIFGNEIVYGTAFGGIVGSGGILSVGSGGVVNFTSVGGSGTEAVLAGGVASGTMVGNGGVETVSPGGTDVGAVASGGFQDVAGTVSGALLEAGGSQMIEAGGVASGTVLDDNNVQFVSGTAVGTIVSAGDAQVVEPGGFAIGTVVSSGGSERVSAGGTSINATLDNGGVETVSAGGNDFNAVISGGVQDVFGAANGALILGGSQFVEAGAVASATVLDAGASQFIFGTASGTVISAGDLAVVEPGGTAVNPIIAGGTLELTPGTLATGSISFTGTGGVLALDGSPLTAAPIAGFAAGDSIDLRGFSVNSLSYANGVLTLNQAAQLNVFTPYATPAFTATADGNGGTLITVAPLTLPTGPASLFDFLYRYNDGRDYYYGTVADNGSFGYQSGQQLATPAGIYTIFNQEAGTTAQAVGTVFVSYYSHGAPGQASTTPFQASVGQPDGSGGLGSESDFVLGTDDQLFPFSSTQEATLSTASLFGFVFTYADGGSFYAGTVADDGSFGYGAVADSGGTKMVFSSAGQFEGYYFIYREGATAAPAGTVTIDRYFSGQTGVSFVNQHTLSGGIDGTGGLGSELGSITINGVQVTFGDPPEAVLPGVASSPGNPADAASALTQIFEQVLGRDPTGAELASASADGVSGIFRSAELGVGLPAQLPGLSATDLGLMQALGSGAGMVATNVPGYSFSFASTANFSAPLSSYSVANLGRDVVVSGPDGNAITVGISQFRFADGSVNTNDGNPLVDALYYDRSYQDVFHAGVNPAQHYDQSGWHEGRDPDAYFSTKGYLNANPDVKAAGIDPLTHYDQYGWKEGRNPSAQFDTEYYLLHNPDVAAAGIDPLQHYLQNGITEARAILPAVGPAGQIGASDFDPQSYLMANPDVAASGMNPYQHFLQYGWKEGRDPNGLFDTGYYLAQNPDVAAAGVNPLVHYDQYGWKEGRDPSPEFSTSGYLAANPDVAAAGVDPLQHFLTHGLYEGRMV